MFLHLPRQRIEIACTRMRSERLPCGQSSAGSFYRVVDVRCRSLCDRCEFLARRWIRGVEIRLIRWSLPRAVDEMSEPPGVTVKTQECVTGMLRRSSVLHVHVFFDDAHSNLLVFSVIKAGFSSS